MVHSNTVNPLDYAQSCLAHGDFAGAEAALRQVLQQQPRHPAALHGMGMLAMQTGRVEEARQWLSQAALSDKRNAVILKDLGHAHIACSDPDAAVKSLRSCLKLKPDLAEAHFYLGWALHLRGEWKEAEQAYQRSLRLADSMPARFNLGNLYLAQERGEAAKREFETALAMQPNFAAAYVNLGQALRLCGDLEAARSACARAAELAPRDPQARMQLANCCHELGDLTAAAAAFESAIALAPDFAEAHLGLAMSLLLGGDYAHGWPEYRWRTRIAAADRFDLRTPLWQGEPLEGKTLLLQAEQGFGDVMQFARYLPAVSERAGRVLLVCHPELKTLLQPLSRYADIAGFNEPTPAHDLHLPLLDLPGILNETNPNSFSGFPYLHADAERLAHWRGKLGEGRKIGLVWAGRPTHLNDRNRSLSLGLLSPLFELPGIRWFSLQKGPAAKQIAGTPLIDLGKELHDFADTAAALACLDLLITVDTAVAHLAGALNIPAWLMLPAVPDWRWGMHGETTPWYPSLRLFRQGPRRRWEEVVERIGAALSAP
jgi:Flp pilus assembly protein TadD